MAGFLQVAGLPGQNCPNLRPRQAAGMQLNLRAMHCCRKYLGCRVGRKGGVPQLYEESGCRVPRSVHFVIEIVFMPLLGGCDVGPDRKSASPTLNSNLRLGMLRGLLMWVGPLRAVPSFGWAPWFYICWETCKFCGTSMASCCQPDLQDGSLGQTSQECVRERGANEDPER